MSPARRKGSAPRKDPARPVGSAAGYSGTPLWKKLGIKAGATVALVDAPDGMEHALAGHPEDVRLRRDLRAGELDVCVLFCSNQVDLKRRFPAAAKKLATAGGLWVAWPKQSSGVPTDLGDAVVRAFGLAAGLVDNKVCAIDATWSGLRFVVRLADRSGR